MNINIDFLKKVLIGTTVIQPISGTLSGHAAGEPFDKHVYKFIKDHFPDKTFRQYELLNKIYSENSKATSVKEKWSLISYPAVSFLLNRGKEVTHKWTLKNLFVEKQNDTADIVVVHKNFFNILDVKTFNVAKNGQPPNIIFAYKLAKMCALMLESKNFTSHDITYIGIAWEIEGKNLKCTNVAIKQLFKTDPSALYINWAAAMQIQFHVEKLSQNYKGSVEQWSKDFLHIFVIQAQARVKTMSRKFIEPFEKFLK